MANKIKVYVGCALTDASESFRNDVQEFKKQLRDAGFDALEFVGLRVAGDDENAGVYDWDINRCVKNADVVVAICDFPSTGLGWELGVATEMHTPVLLLAKEGQRGRDWYWMPRLNFRMLPFSATPHYRQFCQPCKHL